MIALIFTVLFGARAVVGTLEACKSGKLTSSGECCKQCQPGEGVLKECGKTQTECTPCLDSETFSPSWSHTERCQKCTQCTGLMRMDTPCTDTNDATCVCKYGYYADALGGCTPCTVCPVGSGVLMRCEPGQDTLCEDCGGGDLYSDRDSDLEPCLPCTICEDEEVQLQACTRTSDTVCQDLNPPNTTEFAAPSTSPPPATPTPPYDSTASYDATPESATTTTFIVRGFNENLIPIYCSILAAVVAGLLAFIIFKRWNSCKQNKQGCGHPDWHCHPSQTPSPEGEKLHSDSGISVDSQSLQEHTVVKIDGGPCMALPLHSCEEVEKLLVRGGEGHDMTEETDWCSLAGLLGYEEERIATFRKEERPIHALLTDWASQDSASVDTLCTALRKINRDDIVQSLGVKPTATSAV
ncbi:nerve growth factor receptor b [Alosa sapidissima]|uniref:nerve growth factor receptor b n=1 Tax=Alosa sapidissima TaxID=34773 RepID=UPI001C09CF72|nr:nerve growth factor receptor b [Alosa sapidissima]